MSGTRPIHALKPRNPNWHVSRMETVCGVDPYRQGVRVHRSDKSPPIDCRRCLSEIRAGVPHQDHTPKGDPTTDVRVCRCAPWEGVPHLPGPGCAPEYVLRYSASSLELFHDMGGRLVPQRVDARMETRLDAIVSGLGR